MASSSGSARIGGFGLEVVDGLQVAVDRGAAPALDQHLDGAVGQLQQLQHGGDGAGGIDLVGRRIVVLRILLGHDEDVLVVAHDFFERLDRLLAADEQRHDHAGEDDDVAQRQNRVNPVPIGFRAACGNVRHFVSFPGRDRGEGGSRTGAPSKQPATLL